MTLFNGTNMECIEHTQKGSVEGYGFAKRLVAGVRVGAKLHRWVYCDANHLNISDIAGKVVMHTCDNPRCINPAHLRLGTHKENTQDMVAKRRNPVGEAHKRAKLKWADVEAIKQSTETQRELASRYGVSQRAIHKVIHSETWQRH